MKIILIIALLIEIVTGFFTDKFLKIARVDRVEICENGENSPFVWGNMRLENNPKISTLLHCNLTITRDVNRIQALAILNRCSHKEVLDSCEYFTTLRLTNICSLLAKNGTTFSPFVYSFHPPFVCPFHKGEYRLINGSWDMTLFNFFPVGEYYWKGKLQIKDETSTKLYYTICGEGKVTNVLHE